MKKIALVSFSVFAVIFVVITLTRHKPSTGEPKQGDSTHTSIEKERVLRFWEHYREATNLRMDEQWEQAAKSYRQALDLNGQHEDALYYLGNMYLELSRYGEAEESWKKLVQINPNNSRAFLQLGSLYLSSEEFFDIDKAERACLESLKLNKEETGPVLFLGEVHLIRGQLEVAASDFEAVSASNFKSKEAYFLGGYIAWKKGNVMKARELFSQAVKYSKPLDNSADQVIGEGDTKPGKGFGSVTSKSVFNIFITELRDVDIEQIDQTLEKTYVRVDALLAELKRRIP